MKIVFLGTTTESVIILKELIKYHEVLLVISQPDAPVGRKKILTPSPVSMFASENNLPISKPEKIKDNPQIYEQVRSVNAEIFIVVSYGKILPLDFINIPKLKTLNVHYSELPKYRGPSPLQFALMNGDKETAVSIFILDELVDHGPVLAQEKVIIESDDTFTELSERASKQAAKLLIDTIRDYEKGAITPLEQDHTQATKTKLFTKEDGKINWHWSANRIYNQWRAFTPKMGIWTTYEGNILKIHNCKPIANAVSNQVPGTVLPNGTIACGDNTALKLIDIQVAGKKSMPVEDFIRGTPKFIGSLLDT